MSDPTKLSREEKLALLQVLEERAARAKETSPGLTPNSAQLEVLTNQAKNRFVFGGNGLGKSVLCMAELWYQCTGYNPHTGQYYQVPTTNALVLDKIEKFEDKYIPDMKRFFHLKDTQLSQRGRRAVTKVSFDNGSEIFLFSHDQDPLVFESVEFSGIVVFDEPPPRHVWVALKRAGRLKGFNTRYIIACTPVTQPWLRTEIYEPWSKGELSDTHCFKFHSSVNEENLDPGYIKEFSRFLTEKEKTVRLEGAFFDSEGLALAHLFKRPQHLIKKSEFQWNPSWPCVLAVDPHPHKAHVACLVGATESGELVYIKEMARREVARDFARSLKAFIEGYTVVDRVCDSLGSADMTAGEGFRSFIEVLNAEGLRIRATTWQEKSDEDFIDRIRSLLAVPETADNFGVKQPKLKIVGDNFGIIGDIENVQWVKYRNQDEFKPKLELGYRDYLSALKYALACNPVFRYKRGVIQYTNASAYGTTTRTKKDGFLAYVNPYRRQTGTRKPQSRDW